MITAEAAKNLGMEEEDVRKVVDEVMLLLHKGIAEHQVGGRQDYIGGALHFEVGPQAFYHLLGFLDEFSGKYKWEPGDATEYLLRLGRRSDWAPFQHQVRGWKYASQHDDE
jgi:hypothetical protein